MALRDFFGRLRGGGAAQPAPEIPLPSPPEASPPAPEAPLAPVPEPMPEAPPAEIPPPDAEAPTKTGWFARLKAGLSRSTAKLTDSVVSLLHKRRLDDEALEELEETLITADLGVAASRRIVEGFRRTRFGKEVTDEEVKAAG
jgi:fused signal recognition particle receptor